MTLTNQHFLLEPDSTLFKEEADAIVAVILDILKQDGHDLTEGSFVLMGTKGTSSNSKEIIAFDFGDGPIHDFRDKGISSRSFARKILRRDAKNKTGSSHVSYFVDSPLFLRLKTTNGLFSAAMFVDGSVEDVYYALAQAIACMGKEDTVLQDSVNEIFDLESQDYPGINVLRDYVKKLFEKCELPELKAWQEWHDKNSKKLTLFFE